MSRSYRFDPDFNPAGHHTARAAKPSKRFTRNDIWEAFSGLESNLESWEHDYQNRADTQQMRA